MLRLNARRGMRRNEWAKAHFSFAAGNRSRRLVLLEAALMALSLEQIRHAANRVAVSQGLDIVEIEYLGGSKHRVLRIFIEKNCEERAKRAEEARAAVLLSPEAIGGQDASQRLLGDEGVALEQAAWVTHEDCERFSRDFGALLDVEDLVPGSEYTLEVSSPGLDRKLTAPGDFERFRNSLVKVQTFSQIAGNRHWQGRLTEANAERIVLDLSAAGHRSGKRKKPAEQTLSIPFADIAKANLVSEI